MELTRKSAVAEPAPFRPNQTRRVVIHAASLARRPRMPFTSLPASLDA